MDSSVKSISNAYFLLPMNIFVDKFYW